MRNEKHQTLPRPAFVVLEYDGPQWERWLSLAQSAQFYKPAQSDTESRLFPIDAAVTPEPLFARYPDSQHYLVVKAIVRISVIQAVRPKRVEGDISEIVPSFIHVPLPLSNAFSGLSTPSRSVSPRYTITLAYGQRFEPMIATGP